MLGLGIKKPGQMAGGKFDAVLAVMSGHGSGLGAPVDVIAEQVVDAKNGCGIAVSKLDGRAAAEVDACERLVGIRGSGDRGHPAGLGQLVFADGFEEIGHEVFSAVTGFKMLRETDGTLSQ